MGPENSSKSEHGRYEIDPREKGAVFYLEDIFRESDFWLPVSNEPGTKVVGYIKFQRIGEATFVINDIRPGHCPIRGQSILCKGVSLHPKKGL